MASLKNIKNYIKISDAISTSGQPTKKQFKNIAKNDFDVVINLAMHNKGALKKEDKIVTKNNMKYYHIPIVWKDPSIDDLKLFLSTLKILQDEGKKVFIHCIMNYRVSVFIYKYKKHILKKKNVKLKAPKEYKPNKKWKAILKTKI